MREGGEGGEGEEGGGEGRGGEGGREREERRGGGGEGEEGGGGGKGGGEGEGGEGGEKCGAKFGGYETNMFPSHVSTVPFVWRYMDRRYDMCFAAGLLGVDDTDGFLSPQLGFAVLEY